MAEDASKISDIIKYGTIDTIQLNLIKLWEVYNLPNEELLCACKYDPYNSEVFVIYDGQLNLKHKIYSIKIVNNHFKPYLIAISEKNLIYMSTYDENVLVTTDLKFEIKKIFKNNPFAGARNSCCSGDYVFANNYRKIRIFSLHLELIHTIDSDCIIKQIEACNDTLCVNGETKTSFYSISQAFNLLYSYDYSSSRRISVIGSTFYEISSFRQKIWCYNQNGQLEEEIDMESLSKIIPVTFDIRLFYLNKKLYMYFPGRNSLIKFH